MATWKWYYAPNTYKELKLAALRKAGTANRLGVKPEENMTVKSGGTKSILQPVRIRDGLGSLFCDSVPLLLDQRAAQRLLIQTRMSQAAENDSQAENAENRGKIFDKETLWPVRRGAPSNIAKYYSDCSPLHIT
jgi:hypothetical protein